MMKFGRNYRLTIQDTADTMITDLKSGVTTSANLGGATATVIEYPLTAAFIVTRTNSSSLNSMDLQLYNLNETTRDKIFQDRFGYFSSGKGDVTRRTVQLEAGYGDNLYTIFKGNLFEAGTVRRGTDLITHINARDGGYATQLTQTFQTIEPGAGGLTQKQLIETLAAQFPDLEIGAVGDNGVKFFRPISVSGNTYQTLRTYTNNKISIDLGKVYFLEDFQVIDTEIPVIDASSGLLETPNRMENGLQLTVLFEPTLTMDQRIELKSTVMPQYDGTYKITAIRHECIISGAVGGECRTTLTLLIEGRPLGSKFLPVPLATTRNATQ